MQNRIPLIIMGTQMMLSVICRSQDLLHLSSSRLNLPLLPYFNSVFQPFYWFIQSNQERITDCFNLVGMSSVLMLLLLFPLSSVVTASGLVRAGSSSCCLWDQQGFNSHRDGDRYYLLRLATRRSTLHISRPPVIRR